MKHFFAILIQGLLIIAACMYLTQSFLDIKDLDRAFILSITTSFLTIIFIIGLWVIAHKIVRERMTNDKNEK